MNERVRNLLQRLGKASKLLGALPAVLLGAVVGIALYWGLSPSQEAAPVATSPAGHEEKAEGTTIWTCSMHPEVRLPKPGLCPKCGMKLIPLKVDAGKQMAGLRELVTSETAKALMKIETATVERMFPTARIRMVGKIDYDETRLAYITAWVPGRLDRLFVDYTGVAVRKGEHMVYLYSPELYSSQEELLQALQAVKSLERSDVRVVRETAQATVDAVREKLRLLGLTAEQVAQVEQRGKAEDHVTVAAPVSGIVIHKNAQEGMYVQTGMRIYTLADLSVVWAKLDAYESDLSWLRYGQKVEFTSVSYPGEVFAGTISFIDPVLNPVTRTVKVRVNVPNPQGKLKPEMFVDAVVQSQVAAGGRVMEPDLAGKWISPMHPEIVRDEPGPCPVCGMPLVKAESLGYVGAAATEKDKPLVIPVSAALVTGTRAIVYLEKPGTKEPTYEGREIVLGPRAGDYYLVRRGLAEGDRVVTRGNFKIDSALQIQAKPSMMTPEGGGSAGHHHGESARSADGAVKPAAGMELPPLFRQQLEQVLTSADKAQQQAQGTDPAATHAAFLKLDAAVKAVDATRVDGHPHMLWMELSARLGNDALEGQESKTVAEARRVAQSLAANAASLRKQFAMGPEGHAAPGPAEVVPAALGQQLGAVFAGYFAAGEALAGDNPDKAAEGLSSMAQSLQKVDMSLLAGDAHEAWMAHQAALGRILAGAPDAKDLQALRERFALLSDEAASLARRFPPAGASIYYLLHCPMAFEGRGGVWLQESPQVRNPYFGSGMPTCGDVQEVIRGQEAPTSAPAAPATEPEHE